MSAKTPSRDRAQTLSRGVRILEILAEHDAPMTLGEVVAVTGLARTIVHRLLATLVDHGLVRSRAGHGYELSVGLFALGQKSVAITLGATARPVLDRAADAHHCAVILGVIHEDSVISLVTSESSQARVQAHQREGTAIELGTGASGIAALAALPPHPDEKATVTRARRLGFAVSHAAVAAGTVAASAPVHLGRAELEGTVTFVFPDSAAPNVRTAGMLVHETATEIETVFAPHPALPPRM